MANTPERNSALIDDATENAELIREFYREADEAWLNTPNRTWAPADFIYECPASRREP